MSPAVDNISLPVYLCFYYLLRLSMEHNSKLSFCGLLESMGFYSSAQQGISKNKKYSWCSLCINRSRRYTWTLDKGWICITEAKHNLQEPFTLCRKVRGPWKGENYIYTPSKALLLPEQNSLFFFSINEITFIVKLTLLPTLFDIYDKGNVQSLE